MKRNWKEISVLKIPKLWLNLQIGNWKKEI